MILKKVYYFTNRYSRHQLSLFQTNRFYNQDHGVMRSHNVQKENNLTYEQMLSHIQTEKSINEFELKVLKELDVQKESVLNQLKHGIIDSVDAANELNMISAKERKIKKSLVLKVHITEKGTPRKIKYQESKGLWQTIMSDGKRLYATEEDGLIEKLFDYYHLTIQKTTIHDLFYDALEEKKQTTNVVSDTLYQNECAYKRSITEEFGKCDIRNITGKDLQKYTLDLVKSKTLTKNAFLEYKGVLNLIFDYAMQNEIISSNPVSTIKNSTYLKSCKQDSALPEDNILSEEEIELVIAKVRKYMTSKRYNGYFVNGYAILLSIETGMRVAELCSLKWNDVKENVLHIHSQQLSEKKKGGKIYYYAPWTKNEKGVSRCGRKFPLTQNIKDILEELKALQEKMGIQSEYVFCHPDGEWIKTDAYETCLRRLMTSLNLKVTHNHAFRKSLNCNVFIGKLQLPVTQRAKLLGHSVATNEKHYSFGSKNDDLDMLCEKFNNITKNEVTPKSHLEVVKFRKAKSLESA